MSWAMWRGMDNASPKFHQMTTRIHQQLLDDSANLVGGRAYYVARNILSMMREQFRIVPLPAKMRYFERTKVGTDSVGNPVYMLFDGKHLCIYRTTDAFEDVIELDEGAERRVLELLTLQDYDEEMS